MRSSFASSVTRVAGCNVSVNVSFIFSTPLFRDTIERTDSIVSNSIFLSINVESTRLDYHASYTMEITYLNLCLCM